jgi:hypothetical protein
MTGRLPTDPELELAELWLDLADIMQDRYEYWAQAADDEPHPLLRQMMHEIAADVVLLVNSARADADDLLWDYDD